MSSNAIWAMAWALSKSFGSLVATMSPIFTLVTLGRYGGLHARTGVTKSSEASMTHNVKLSIFIFLPLPTLGLLATV
jgi:hypothetical protein